MKTIKIPALFALLVLVPALALFAKSAPVKNRSAKAPAATSAPAQTPAAPAPAVAAPAVPETDPFDEALANLIAEDPAVRRQGANFLAQLRSPKAAPALMGALEDAAAPVRQSAVEGLGLLAWREATTKISALLTQDTDAGVRQQAAISLSYLLDPAAGQALLEALADPVPAVRYAAMRTLGAMKYKPAEGKLRDMLEESDVNTLRSAISALGMIQSSKAAPAIISALKNPDLYVRVEAARALGDIGSASSAPELKSHLAGAEHAAVRLEAALALAKLGTGDGLPVAREFLSSPDLSLKSKALNVIVAAGDLESLALIGELAAAEKNPGAKGMLNFARQRLLDIKEKREKKK